MTVLLSSRTNESELLFTVISNATLQSISTAFALRRQVKLQKTSGNRDAHPSPRTALWALVLVIHSKRKHSVIILTLKTVFDKQIYYENRIKILRFKLIKGFWKIIQILLWIKKNPNKNTSKVRKITSFYFCDSKAQNKLRVLPQRHCCGCREPGWATPITAAPQPPGKESRDLPTPIPGHHTLLHVIFLLFQQYLEAHTFSPPYHRLWSCLTSACFFSFSPNIP